MSISENIAAIRQQMLSDRQGQKEKHTTEETGNNRE